ncbi:MAG: DUF1501 domain-containing protein [Kineosporiaceae bacterium]
MTSTPPAGTRDCGCPEGAAASGLSRRGLLKGVLGGAALGGLATVAGETASARYAFAAGPYDGDVLVVLSLRGGMDGLNVVVPTGDADYLRLRPTIGLQPGALIARDARFGLHPALKPLLPFWQAGTFGAVHAVGQADPTRSHFEAMAEMERAAPGSSMRTGWLDRTLGLRPSGTAFQAAMVGSTQVPSSLIGDTPEMCLWSIDSFDLSGAWDTTERTRWTTAVAAMYAEAPEPLAGPARITLDAVGTMAALSNDTAYTPGATYPDGDLGRTLRDIAHMIKAGIGLQVACLDFGDWDMHAGMGTADDGWLHDHLGELALALAAFATDLGPKFADVTLVTLSEFGRRAEENGSGGVDHGHGNAVLMLGGGVVGGRVHGVWPGLGSSALVDGDLAGTTDYRVLLGEILQKRCRLGSVSSVFPGLSSSGQLGVVRARA